VAAHLFTAKASFVFESNTSYILLETTRHDKGQETGKKMLAQLASTLMKMHLLQNHTLSQNVRLFQDQKSLKSMLRSASEQGEALAAAAQHIAVGIESK
jgi:hypothetical protein